MISMAIQCPAVAGLKGVSGLGKAIKYYSMATSIGFSIINSDFNGFVSTIINGTIDEDKLNENLVIPAQYKSQNYTLGWAHELLSFSSDLEALENTFKQGPHFYKEIFTHCKGELNYNILFRESDNALVSMADICSIID